MVLNMLSDTIEVFRRTDELFNGYINDEFPFSVVPASSLDSFHLALDLIEPPTRWLEPPPHDPPLLSITMALWLNTTHVANLPTLEAPDQRASLSAEAFSPTDFNKVSVWTGELGFTLAIRYVSESNSPLRPKVSLGTVRASVQRKTGDLRMEAPGEDQTLMRWIYCEDKIEIRTKDLLKFGNQYFEATEVTRPVSPVTPGLSLYEVQAKKRTDRW